MLPALRLALLCAFALPAAAPAQKPAVAEGHHYFRRYQAGAYVSLLSVRILTRNGVGFGHAKADEEPADGGKNLSLQFLSGSIPEHAHGLNRFGFIQEHIQELAGRMVEGAYLGLITNNAEESFFQARAALNSSQANTQFIAAQATIDPKWAHFGIRNLTLSSNLRGANATQLIGHVRSAFEHPEDGQPEHTFALKGEPLDSFLYSVRAATLASSDKMQRRFIYNGKFYRLVTEKRPDERVGLELQQAGLIETPSSATRLTGAIHNEKTSEVTNFHLWFDRDSPNWLPLRFDFRPKSYLRLVFQAEKL